MPEWRRLSGAAWLALAAGLLGACPGDPAHPATGHGVRAPACLGVNIGQVGNRPSQSPFLDLVKQAPGWNLFEGGPPVPVDAQGWPTSIPPGARAGFAVNAPRRGRFVATFEGDGDIAVRSGGRLSRPSRGRVEVELDGGPAVFELVRTNPRDPLRSLSIVPAEFEHSHRERVFDPDFLELARPFGVLRFHDWLRVVDSELAHWRDRPKPDDFSQGTSKGASVEYAIDLCNRLGADCWLNVPHMADDEYVEELARLVRDRLRPSLRVYVEYSNEVWNYAHGDWCERAGEALGMPREWDTRLRYQAHRSLEVFRIFERILGTGTGKGKGRLVRVLASQAVRHRAEVLVEWEGAYREADALAIAPYFCEDAARDLGASQIERLGPAGLADRCLEDVENLRGRVRALRALADRRGLSLVGYEGGQSLVASAALEDDATVQGVLDEANRLPQMGLAYGRLFRLWSEEGGSLLALYKLVYSPTKWGRWGLVETLSEPAGMAPKYRAALEFIRNEPRQCTERH